MGRTGGKAMGARTMGESSCGGIPISGREVAEKVLKRTLTPWQNSKGERALSPSVAV